MLIEDNIADVRITMEALKQSLTTVNLNVVSDGEQALSYLHRQGEYSNAPIPDLILLDLNIPKTSGFEILVTVKRDLKLCVIPIIVLSTSSAEHDITLAYTMHANAYVCKPFVFAEFITFLQAFQEFWLKAVALPIKANELV